MPFYEGVRQKASFDKGPGLTNLVMILLQATQLFPEGFKLHLQIRPAKGQLIQYLT